MTQTSATQRGSEQADAIRPFNVNFPEAELTELRRRINATKWPERETVTDASQGVQLATIQALARYWATDEDHRSADQSHRTRWKCIRCFPPGDPVNTGLRILRKTDHHRVGWSPHRACLGRADEAPRVHEIRGSRRRLGCGHHRTNGCAGGPGIARHSHQYAWRGSGRH